MCCLSFLRHSFAHFRNVETYVWILLTLCIIWPVEAQSFVPSTQPIAKSNAAQLQLLATLPLDAELLFDMTWLKDGRTLAVANTAGIHLVSMDSLTLNTLVDEPAYAVETSPDSQWLVMATGFSYAKQFTLYNLHTGAMLQLEHNFVDTFAFSNDSALLASGGGWQIKLWDLKTFQQIAVMNLGKNDVEDILFSPDSYHILTNHLNGAFLWDLNSVLSGSLTTITQAYALPPNITGSTAFDKSGGIVGIEIGETYPTTIRGSDVIRLNKENRKSMGSPLTFEPGIHIEETSTDNAMFLTIEYADDGIAVALRDTATFELIAALADFEFQPVKAALNPDMTLLAIHETDYTLTHSVIRIWGVPK